MVAGFEMEHGEGDDDDDDDMRECFFLYECVFGC